MNVNIQKLFIKKGFTQEQTDKIIAFYSKNKIAPFEQTDLSDRLGQLHALFALFGKKTKETNKKLTQFPKLLSYTPQTLKKNIIQCAESFNKTPSEWVTICWSHPNVLTRTAKNILSCLEKQSTVLEIPLNDWTKSTLKNITVLSCSPATLKNNIDTITKQLKISQNDWIRGGLRNSSLFCLAPQSIFQKVHKNATALNISDEKFVRVIAKAPEVLSLNSETLLQRIAQTAKTLNISPDEWIKACCRAPTLFYASTESIQSKIRKNAELFETNETTIIDAFLKTPQYFYRDPAQTAQKVHFLTQMYLKDLFQIKDKNGKKTIKWFKSFLLKKPSHIRSLESLHLRCTYARYLRYAKKPIGTAPFYHSNQKIEEILSHAPAEFLKKELVFRRMYPRQKQNEKQNG